MLNTKIYIYLSVIVFLLVIGGIIVYQADRIDTLKTELITSEANSKMYKIIYDEEIDKARKTINTQNTLIEEFIIDSNAYENIINEKEKELIVSKIKSQEAIKNALKNDNSVENQFRLIVAILEEFNETSR